MLADKKEIIADNIMTVAVPFIARQLAWFGRFFNMYEKIISVLYVRKRFFKLDTESQSRVELYYKQHKRKVMKTLDFNLQKEKAVLNLMGYNFDPLTSDSAKWK